MTNTQKSGLAIGGFATTMGGILICFSGIGAVIGIPAIIVGIILATIALQKKQQHRNLSIAAIAAGGIAIITGGILFRKLRQIASPIIQGTQEVQSLVENDPELKNLMKDPKFNTTFETIYKAKMEAKAKELENKVENKEMSVEEVSKAMGNLISSEMISAIKETKEQMKK